jgi:hypothetical protein
MKLADQIFEILRKRTGMAEPRITYSDLIPLLKAPYNTLSCRSDVLDAALAELVLRCRLNDLPAISALVVNVEMGRPGKGYYKVAHPNGTELDQIIAWACELKQIQATKYPASL